ncbi:MAG: choice-of-anchor Q domain-containing protein, partial [Planctomycetota bacterium]
SATHFSGIGGGGIYNLDGVLTLTNSIVGNSSSGGDCYNDGGVLNDNGFNIVEDGSCGFPAAGDPTLGPLTDNGGPTQTHAMLPGSIAINAIDNPAACTVTMKLPLNVGRTASRGADATSGLSLPRLPGSDADDQGCGRSSPARMTFSVGTGIRTPSPNPERPAR